MAFPPCLASVCLQFSSANLLTAPGSCLGHGSVDARCISLLLEGQEKADLAYPALLPSLIEAKSWQPLAGSHPLPLASHQSLPLLSQRNKAQTSKGASPRPWLLENHLLARWVKQSAGVGNKAAGMNTGGKPLCHVTLDESFSLL